ncbi:MULTISPECIES: copper resistance CopC family protein [Streptomyces]|uniref:copper resistance CopC family protein n=1 Tax=Streptomyces TaxID=1883 RepID=UPI002259D70F|nr:copper resistance CopC family protein [Streptomyces virginiae]MCX5275320.1 copper resistance protein CopC [Streptomyces virginiae]
MRSFTRRAARTAARTLALPLSAAFLWAGAPAASAHTDLTSSSPSDGATLDTLPSNIRLTFSDEMTDEYAKIALTAPDGSPAGVADPQVDGKGAALAVKPGLPSGTYTVGYRVVSADGHPVSGSYSFTVRAAATGTTAPVPAPSSPPPAPSGAAPHDSGDSPAPTAIADGSSPSSSVATSVGLGVLIVAAAGAAVFVARRRRVHRGD